jgi:hypothetical protein
LASACLSHKWAINFAIIAVGSQRIKRYRYRALAKFSELIRVTRNVVLELFSIKTGKGPLIFQTLKVIIQKGGRDLNLMMILYLFIAFGTSNIPIAPFFPIMITIGPKTNFGSNIAYQ